MKFQHETNLRAKAESAAAAAEEKASHCEREFSSLSESIEREKSRLHNELEQLKSESKTSVSRISKNVRNLLFIEILIKCTSLGCYLISDLIFVQFERMECRAVNAEKESVLLKEQMEELRVRLKEVTTSSHFSNPFYFFNNINNNFKILLLFSCNFLHKPCIGQQKSSQF